MSTVSADFEDQMSRNIVIAFLGALVWLVTSSVPQAAAASYYFPASCAGSYSKQGDEDADLTKIAGAPIRCDAVLFSLPENGNALIQLVDKSSRLTPIGFAGDGLDYESNPNFVTIPLRRIYLPHSSDPGKPESVGGIHGFCFLDGKMNIRLMAEIDCSAKIELGAEKLLYRIKAKVTGLGQRVPGT